MQRPWGRNKLGIFKEQKDSSRAEPREGGGESGMLWRLDCRGEVFFLSWQSAVSAALRGTPSEGPVRTERIIREGGI